MSCTARVRLATRSPTFEPRLTNPWRGSFSQTAQYALMAWAQPATSWTRRMRAPLATAAMQMPCVAASRSTASSTPETAPTKRLRLTAVHSG